MFTSRSVFYKCNFFVLKNLRSKKLIILIYEWVFFRALIVAVAAIVAFSSIIECNHGIESDRGKHNKFFVDTPINKFCGSCALTILFKCNLIKDTNRFKSPFNVCRLLLQLSDGVFAAKQLEATNCNFPLTCRSQQPRWHKNPEYLVGGGWPQNYFHFARALDQQSLPAECK